MEGITARRTATRAGRTAVREGDQYLLRLPPGMRERLEQRAAENGRAMSAEVIEAIEKHLLGADRITQLWEDFGKHKENIEAISMMLSAIAKIEVYLAGLGVVTDSGSDFASTSEIYSTAEVPRVVSAWQHQKEQEAYAAYVATLPLATAEQVQIMRDLIKEINDLNMRLGAGVGNPDARVYRWNEKTSFLDPMNVSQIEDIRDFQKAIKLLEERRQFMRDRLQSLQSLT